jgi:hypothetical protein
MMNIRELTRDEIIKVFKEYMVIDFPHFEIKPLKIILDLLDKQRYSGYGLFDENELIGYSFLAKSYDDNWILLDYFAICNNYRNLGYGSKYLELLFDELRKIKTKALIIEIEKIECGKNGEEVLLRTRRKEFYLKNGVISTGSFATIFDIEFEILYYPTKEKNCSKKIIDKYMEFYQMMLPKKMYEENCFI